MIYPLLYAYVLSIFLLIKKYIVSEIKYFHSWNKIYFKYLQLINVKLTIKYYSNDSNLISNQIFM